MITATIFPGRYVQGFGALQALGAELVRFGRRALVVADPLVHEQVMPSIITSLEGDVELQVERFCGECTDEEVSRLTTLGLQPAPQMVVGIGGGKTLDTAKAAANEMGLPVILAPTIASTDAPCSALSVIYTSDGQFKRYLFYKRNPDVVLVDTCVISRAPVRFLVSGMGDALATWFEAESCRVKRAANMTGKSGSMTAYALARLCYDTLLSFGVLAKSACEAHVSSPALEKVVEANTLLSGLGFESGGLAAAHAIHNGLTALAPTHQYYHGEKVAMGTLASLFLTAKEPQVLDEVFSFCEAIGLPTTLAGIGIGQAGDEELLAAARKACAPGETIHNEPFPVSPEAVFQALRAADAEGRRRAASWMRS